MDWLKIEHHEVTPDHPPVGHNGNTLLERFDVIQVLMVTVWLAMRYFSPFLAFWHFLTCSAIVSFLFIRSEPVFAAENELLRLAQSAKDAMNAHEYDKAVHQADAFLKIQPKNGEFQYLKGRALFLEHKAQEALSVYSQVLTLNPSDVLKQSVYNDMAVCCTDLEQLDCALKYLDQALAIKPDAYSYKLKGQILRLRHDEVRAAESLQKAVALNPKDYWSTKELTSSYMVQKRYGDALKTSNEMVKLRPGEPEPYNTRARVFEKLGRPADAKMDIETAKKRTTEFPF